MINIRKKTFSISKATKTGEEQDWIPFFCEHCGRKLRAGKKEYHHIKPCPGCAVEITYPDPSFGVGQLIADYMIDGWVAAGSMGEVYMAHNVKTQQKVALKLLNSQIPGNGVKLFKQECDLLSYFRHPNIVRENGSGIFQGCYYLAMDFMEGECLNKIVLREDYLPEDLVLSILSQTVDALHYVWSKFGVRHRDLKPANLMIDEIGNLMIIDWGMAKQKFHNDDLEAHGSPLFMDPVCFTQNTGLDCRSDIYTLGATAFHLLTGDYPFFEEDIDSLVDLVLASEVPRVDAVNPKISKMTADLVYYMMGKTYETRYQNWQEVGEAINQVVVYRRGY